MTLSWQALLPTPAWLRWAIVPVLAFVATLTDRHYLADFWHHLARGRAMVEHGQIVDHDLFTFTVAGQPFQDVNWLTQICYFGLYSAGGLTLVQVVNSLVIAVTMFLVVQICKERGRSLMAAMIAGGVAFFGVWEVLTIRPQTLSMLLFVVVLHLLERGRGVEKGSGPFCAKHPPCRSGKRGLTPFRLQRRPWVLAVVPALVALWANLHGAFPAGIILVGCYAAESMVLMLRERLGRPRIGGADPANASRNAWRFLACFVACVLASCLNPYGWRIYRYVAGTSAVAYQRQIAEWEAPGPDRLIGFMWMASVVLVVGLLAWRWLRTRQLPALRDVLMLACFFVLSCGSARMVAWWMLVSAPVLAELLARLVPTLTFASEDDSRPSLVTGGVFGLVALAVAFSLPGLDRFNPLLGPTRRGPRVEDDLEAIQRHLAASLPAGNIYSHFEWGEYLSWSAAPRCPVFMDGRIEIYPDDVWQKYTAVTMAQGNWDDILAEYHVQYLILDTDYHGRTGLLQRVSTSADWQPAYQARSAVLFVRKTNALAAR